MTQHLVLRAFQARFCVPILICLVSDGNQAELQSRPGQSGVILLDDGLDAFVARVGQLNQLWPRLPFHCKIYALSVYRGNPKFNQKPYTGIYHFASRIHINTGLSRRNPQHPEPPGS
jgi:hypothetical protein